MLFLLALYKTVDNAHHQKITFFATLDCTHRRSTIAKDAKDIAANARLSHLAPVNKFHDPFCCAEWDHPDCTFIRR
jgi:hypothetical protein